MNHQPEPPRSAGARRRRIAQSLVILSALLGNGIACGVEAQLVVTDSLWTGDEVVELLIPLDSLIVVPVDSLELPDLSAIVKGVVPGAAEGRFPGGLGWVYWVPPMAREELVSAARAIQAHPRIRWAGFMVRRPRSEGSAMVTDEVLIRFQPGVGPLEVDEMIGSWGLDLVREPTFDGDHHLLLVTDASPGDALITSNEARLDSRVDYAQPNFIFEVLPGGTASGVLPASQWHHAAINTPGAWGLTRGEPGTVLAIIEFNGYDIDHPDLIGRGWVNPWENGTGTGGEPFDRKPGDLHGWNFEGCGGVAGPLMSDCGTPNVSTSNDTHGTQVAGMAAGSENLVSAVSGVCPECSIMFISLSKHSGYSNSSEIRGAAYSYAYLQGADVINSSWHSFFSDNPVRAAIQAAAELGRGGKGTNIVTIPSNVSDVEFDFCVGASRQLASLDSVIAVVQSDENDTGHAKAMGECLHLVAPGFHVRTTDPEGTAGDSNTEYVDDAEGNSYAAPVVAGVVGLMLTRNPSLTWLEVKDILRETADKVPGPLSNPAVYDPITGHSDSYGYGRVNAFGAVGLADPGGIPLEPEEEVLWPFVVPMEWRVDYRSGDHHVNEHGLWKSDQAYDVGSGRLDWITGVSFADKNFDDDFWWEVSHGVVSLPGAYTHGGESPWISDSGGQSTDARSFQSPDLVGFDAATVVLGGWQFDYSDKDHHLDVIGIRIADVEYDAATGTLTWNTTAEFQDRESDDGYRWRYQWQVVALDQGAVVPLSRSGEDSGNTHLDESSETDATLQGFKNAVVLPRGWRFDFRSKDHEINEHRFGIRNISFEPETGRVRWTAVFNYSDKNFDDDYLWEYYLTAIAFEDGTFFPWWSGPVHDGGGEDQRELSVIVRMP